MNKVELSSVITCPVCNYSKEEVMDENSCLHFYECNKCRTLLKPEQGDCCVFCSYGSIKCPPVQRNNSCEK